MRAEKRVGAFLLHARISPCLIDVSPGQSEAATAAAQWSDPGRGLEDSQEATLVTAPHNTRRRRL